MNSRIKENISVIYKEKLEDFTKVKIPNFTPNFSMTY